MQPYFFPYIGYFQAIKAVDKYILYENLNYIKEGWMNKNRIQIKKQKPNYISVSLQKKSSNKKIKHVELNNLFNWKKKLINKVYLNYKGSAFFYEVFPLIEDCINIEADLLHNYNSDIIKKIAGFLEIETEIQSENREYLDLEYNLEKGFLDLGENDIKTNRALEICKKERADVFINAIGGRELYSKARFKKEGIDLYFVKTNEISYIQFSDQFYPNLSIIDVLMNCGKENTKSLLNNYELI